MVEIRMGDAGPGDRLHDQQLLRELDMINARTREELGLLPLNGLPVIAKRKPVLPKRELAVVAAASPGTASFPVSRAIDDIPTDPEGAEMFILGKLFKKKAPQEPWPIRFDSFSFGARCYNTLKCRVVFQGTQELSDRVQDGPSGEPRSPDWKDKWYADHIVMASEVFPPPADVRWTALDGVARHAEIDLKDIFPDRLVLHNVAREEIKPGWENDPSARSVDILLEVNDRTINIYMRGRIVQKELADPSNPNSAWRNDLILAWTKTY
jgi:hypothetical protein